MQLVRNAFVAGYEEGEKMSAPSNVPGLLVKDKLRTLVVICVWFGTDAHVCEIEHGRASSSG